MTDWVLYVLLMMVLSFGLFINILTLPGLWLMVLAALGYAWYTDFTYMGLWSLVSITVLAILAEVAEFALGAAGAKTAGGSKRSMVGAIVGAILGGLFLSVLIPIPILGTIIGVCLGAFAGAASIEWMIRQDMDHSVNVGIGAAKGRFWGIISKLGFGFVMLIITAWAALPLGRTTPVPVQTTPPTTMPTTAPLAAPQPATQPN